MLSRTRESEYKISNNNGSILELMKERVHYAPKKKQVIAQPSPGRRIKLPMRRLPRRSEFSRQ
jgi:hypothetical protein